MKTNHKLALAVLVGVVVGIAGATAIHARQIKAPGYVVAQIDVSDPAMYQTYADKTPATLAPFGGHYIVRGGKPQVVEGDPPSQRIVIIAFDSVEKAKAWEYSPAYEAIKPIRHSAAKSRICIVEGLAP